MFATVTRGAAAFASAYTPLCTTCTTVNGKPIWGPVLEVLLVSSNGFWCTIGAMLYGLNKRITFVVATPGQDALSWHTV